MTIINDQNFAIPFGFALISFSINYLGQFVPIDFVNTITPYMAFLSAFLGIAFSMYRFWVYAHRKTTKLNHVALKQDEHASELESLREENKQLAGELEALKRDMGFRSMGG